MPNPNKSEECPLPPEFKLAQIMWRATSKRSTWSDVIKAADTGNVQAIHIRDNLMDVARSVIDDGWHEATDEERSKDQQLSKAKSAVDDLADALRLTVEYIGNDMLPAKAGWSWFDALLRHRPKMAEEFRLHPIRLGKSGE